MLHLLTSPSSASAGPGAGAHRFRRGRFRPDRESRDDQGKWIWVGESQTRRNYYLYVRKTFELPSKPTKAVLKAGANSKYKLYVNGHYVGKGPARPSEGYSYYDSHDISELLVKGGNVIAFLAHHFGVDTYFGPAGLPGLICKAEIEVGEESTIIVTDETWRVRRAEDRTDLGAPMSESLGFQEVYDAARTIEGWNEVRFKERDWQDAVVIGTAPSLPWGKLIRREIPPSAEEWVFPKAVTGMYNSPERSPDLPPEAVPQLMASDPLSPPRAGSVNAPEALMSEHGLTHVGTPRGAAGVVMILDFGREVFGNVEIGIAGSGTGCIDLGYGELLEDGRVKPDRGGARYTDRLLLKKGRLDWESFEPRAFRYLQIEFRRCSKPVALEYVRVNESVYPASLAASFECSDTLLNEIWHAGVMTTRLCMEDSFIDSPLERIFSWSAARICSRAAYYAFDDTKLLARGLRQVADSQRRDGWIPGAYPADGKPALEESLLWVFSILDYYAFSDDSDLPRDLYPSVARLLNWFERHAGDEGLLSRVPGDLFAEKADPDRYDEITALNCLYYQALRVAAVIAEILDRNDDSEEYSEAARRLRLAINKYLYSPRRGLYAEGRTEGKLVEKFSPRTNILAALFDIADQYQKATIIRQVIGDSRAEIETPYLASYLLELLYTMESHEDALDIIRKRWGGMIKAGATTFWEQFTQDAGLCHASSTGVTRDLIAEFVGIKPVPGARRFSVTPRPGDLKWARGSIGTESGPLTVEWKLMRGAFVVNVEVPSGIKVDVFLPCPPYFSIRLDGRMHTSPFITLGPGSHQVRVISERPPKPAPLDESLKPEPIRHVEVIEGLSRRRGPRGMFDGARGRGRDRRERRHEGAEETPAEIKLEAEMRPVTQREAAEKPEEAHRKPRRRRSRRPARGPGSSRPETVETAPTIEPETKTQPAAEHEAAEKPEEAHRRPRSRRSRRPGPGASRESAPGAATTEQQESAPAPSEPLETSPETGPPAPSRRRRGYSRRPRTRRSPGNEQQTGEAGGE